MREVRRALLEADVALDVVKQLHREGARPRRSARRSSSRSRRARWWSRSSTTSWSRMLGSDAAPIDLAAAPPVAILMVGLQGSGKTTTTAKIAYRLTNRDKKKVLMASLDTRRPAAQEQLRVLGEQTERRQRCRSSPASSRSQIAQRAMEAARLGGYDVVLLDTAGRTTVDEALMAEVADVKARDQPARDAAGRRRADRPGRRQHREGIRRPRRHHRHRADPRRRRWPRRRGAVDARGHRQADQADRRRREVGRARGLPSRAHRQPHPRHGRHRQPGREGGAELSTPSKAAKMAAKMKKGEFDLRRPRRPAQADGEDRRHGRHHGHDAGRRQDEGADRRVAASTRRC